MDPKTPPESTAPHELHFEVICPAQRPMLRVLRRFVAGVAEEAGFRGEDLYKIEMSVDEACSNVTEHAFAQPGGDPAQRMELKLSWGSRMLTIQVGDHGRGLGPAGFHGSADLGDYQRPDRQRYRGLGILVMKEFMDEVHFEDRPERGTLVTLRKRLNPDALGHHDATPLIWLEPRRPEAPGGATQEEGRA